MNSFCEAEVDNAEGLKCVIFYAMFSLGEIWSGGVWDALHFYASLRGPGLQQALKCVRVSFCEWLCIPYLSTCHEERDHELQLRWGPERGFCLSQLEPGNRQGTLGAFLPRKHAGSEESSLSKYFRETHLKTKNWRSGRIQDLI